jgi:hypothetical protein
LRFLAKIICLISIIYFGTSLGCFYTNRSRWVFKKGYLRFPPSTVFTSRMVRNLGVFCFCRPWSKEESKSILKCFEMSYFKYIYFQTLKCQIPPKKVLFLTDCSTCVSYFLNLDRTLFLNLCYLIRKRFQLTQSVIWQFLCAVPFIRKRF